MRNIGLLLGMAVLFAGMATGEEDRNMLPGSERRRMSRAASQANPTLTKRINDAAAQCLSKIQSELIVYSKQHSVLEGIEHEQLHLGLSSGEVRRELFFSKNNVSVRVPSGATMIPRDDGIIIRVGVLDTAGKFSVIHDWELLIDGIEMTVYYNVEVGKNNKEIEKTVCELIDKHLRAFCEAMKKLQTTEGSRLKSEVTPVK